MQTTQQAQSTTKRTRRRIVRINRTLDGGFKFLCKPGFVRGLARTGVSHEKVVRHQVLRDQHPTARHTSSASHRRISMMKLRSSSPSMTQSS